MSELPSRQTEADQPVDDSGKPKIDSFWRGDQRVVLLGQSNFEDLKKKFEEVEPDEERWKKFDQFLGIDDSEN